MPAGKTKSTRSAGKDHRAARSNGCGPENTAACGMVTSRAATSGSAPVMRAPKESWKTTTLAAPSRTRRTGAARWVREGAATVVVFHDSLGARITGALPEVEDDD